MLRAFITISWTSFSLNVLGPRSRSQWLFLVNVLLVLLCFHTNVKYGKSLGKLGFQNHRAKVKVIVAVLRKLCQCSGPLICRLISIELYTNV